MINKCQIFLQTSQLINSIFIENYQSIFNQKTVIFYGHETLCFFFIHKLVASKTMVQNKWFAIGNLNKKKSWLAFGVNQDAQSLFNISGLVPV